MKLINISSKVRRKNLPLDNAAIFDILLIAIMLTLLSSKFITAPGLSIDLNNIQTHTADLDEVLIDDNLSVLNIKGSSMIIYDGEIFNIQKLKSKLSNKNSQGTLLIKTDKNVLHTTILEICKLAKDSGFKRVQIAAKPENE